MTRGTRNQGDVLLDPDVHPVGTRLLLKINSFSNSSSEAFVLEWAPSAKRVKLNYVGGNVVWVECWDYDPIVVEVLPPLDKETASAESPSDSVLPRGYVKGFNDGVEKSSLVVSVHHLLDAIYDRKVVEKDILRLMKHTPVAETPLMKESL